MSINVAIIIGAVLALAGTIAACILIMPESKVSGLNKFLLTVRDIFSFKELLLEKILRVLYIFSTLLVICGGFFMLFSGYRGWYDSSFHSYALYGLILIIVGPFVVRITYESFMLFILLVKNTISINNKMPAAPAAVASEAKPAVAPKMIYCSVCGTRYDANAGGCPNDCKPE